MKKLLPIFLITIGLNACSQKNQNEDNYIKSYSGIIQVIKEYPGRNCDIGLDRRWVQGVDLNDCKKVNIGDKVLFVEKVENGLVRIKMQKLNPNLP
ncbi:MAG: hypothetical protein HYY86_01235 [Candidatus Harrisonbacteria bacterium]|nr:hypothetical protein [Candidatus Harrisonbacteria bacterium]